jgi:AraC family transcriptional regulator
MKNILIKNMVCDRCKIVVRQELDKLGLHAEKISLGEVLLNEEINNEQLGQLDKALISVGFERIDDRKAQLIESIKKKIIEMIHHAKVVDRKFNWSYVLAEELHYDYSYLSNLFSSVEGITLEHYIIAQKIERAKELLFYDELTLSEIAQRLGYSSVAHLSSQFKKVTGLTPSALKKSRTIDQRKPIDNLS